MELLKSPQLDLARLRRCLVDWYGRNRRDLPWRRTRHPYPIWLAEIMLQQTRVAVVVNRFPKFLGRFPSVEKLAAARLSAILNEWSGLGYYQRARNLHRAAQTIVRSRRGQFPAAAEAWRQLPGVGRYTAAAIASITAAEPVAVLDGNVHRVLQRLLGGKLTARESWSAAQALLDTRRPGEFNQAMMELGATVCLPGQPVCATCPIRKFCRTCGAGRSERPRRPRRKRRVVYGLAQKRHSVRLVKRSEQDRLMPGMWELPEIDRRAGQATLFTLRHSITRSDYRVRVVDADGFRPRRGVWIRVSRLTALPLTGLARKILHRAKLI